jgi:hypothetical protein
VGDLLLDSVASIKENLLIRRVARVAVPAGAKSGSVFGYVHSQIDPAANDPASGAAETSAADAAHMQRTYGRAWHAMQLYFGLR